MNSFQQECFVIQRNANLKAQAEYLGQSAIALLRALKSGTIKLEQVDLQEDGFSVSPSVEEMARIQEENTKKVAEAMRRQREEEKQKE